MVVSSGLTLLETSQNVLKCETFRLSTELETLSIQSLLFCWLSLYRYLRPTEHLLFWSKAKIIFWMIQFWNFLSAKMALFRFVWQRPILKLWGKVFTFILTINWFWFNYFWLMKNGNLETEPQLVFLGVHGWGQPRTSNTLGLLQFFTFFTT